MYEPDTRRLLFALEYEPRIINAPEPFMYTPTFSEVELLLRAKNIEFTVWFAGRPEAICVPFDNAPVVAIVASNVTTLPFMT